MQENTLFSEIFKKYGVDGTFVVSSIGSTEAKIYNLDRANKKFTPASTFKIPNSLIALEEKVISSKDDIIKWDGNVFKYPKWNKDQTLDSAFKCSCVWFYQELARRIGKEKYKEYFSKFPYGTLEENFELTTFWLDDSLKISAIEKVEFLKKVYDRSLPFSKLTFDALEKVMLVEKTQDFVLRAKTGWSQGVGWFVGYVENNVDTSIFALNINIVTENDLPIRVLLTRELLRALEIIN
jgi:beta-lactamase class D